MGIEVVLNATIEGLVGNVAFLFYLPSIYLQVIF